MKNFAAAILVAGLGLVGTIQAEEIKVMTSGGFTAAYNILGPRFAAEHNDTLKTILGPSMGKAPEAIPNRLAKGEKADVVIMVGYALAELIEQGQIEPGTRVELADSRIGAVVHAGAAKPRIDSIDELKQTLLSADSVAYSDSASGVYIQTQLFKRLDIEDQLLPKAHMIEKIPVATVVATGNYQLGFQQVSELLPVPGVTYIGKIAEPLQSVTRFAGAIPKEAEHSEEAKSLLAYLASKEVQPEIQSTGLDSVP
ncbi:substrate-binding domain-containing protein [Azomonas macrocytogenes]|nr:substrate-binding domain-containing protein [Azomonas macrocytogenes]